MRELYRRFGALLLLFLAVTFFLAVRDDVIRLYAVDMAEEYRSAYLPVEGWGASTAMRGVVRSSKRISSVAAFIDAHTEGRLEVVEGKSWEEIFAGVLAPPETSPLPDRRASDTWRASYYFLPQEEPFPDVFREMKSADQAFRFLRRGFCTLSGALPPCPCSSRSSSTSSSRRERRRPRARWCTRSGRPGSSPT